MSRLQVWVESPGIAAPGLVGWAAASSVLRGQAPYQAEDLPRYAPELLPPNERRRATPVCRLAFQVAEQALAGSAIAATELAGVFASSGGDTGVLNKLCQALASEQRPVSPTQFHNSVHNAAAGYWSIATRACGPSTSLSAHDASFAAGLLEAAVLCQVDLQPTLLAAYDVPPEGPLWAKRPIPQPFGCALVLTPQRSDKSLGQLQLALQLKGEASRLTDSALESLRQSNPAARALPLLQALASGTAGTLVLPAVGNNVLSVTLTPCT